MGGFFYQIFVQPLFNLLVLLYKHVAFEDLGVAIILLTLLIRFILYPLFYKAFRSQTIMQKIQPEIKRIQKEFKDDKERQVKEMMVLWKENKVNPFSSFFMLLIQLPVIFALYRIFLAGFTEETFAGLYGFISAPIDPHNSLLGLINLTEPNMLVVGLAAISQYFQAKMSLSRQKPQEADKAAQLNQKMVFIGPALTLIILPQFPAAVGLYWLTTTVFSVFQQKAINKSVYGGESGKNSS